MANLSMRIAAAGCACGLWGILVSAGGQGPTNAAAGGPVGMPAAADAAAVPGLAGAGEDAASGSRAAATTSVAEPRQGGDTCELATVIAGLPYHVTGTTEDYTHDYDAVCPHNAPGSPDVVYAYAPPADVSVDISLCHPGTTYDTKLYVYKNLCQGTPLACNDDACPGYVSQIMGLTLLAGDVHFIVVDGYGGQAGEYELTISGTPPAPACPEDALFSQPAARPVDSWFAVKSEVSTGQLRYESYDIGAGQSVGALRVWGLRVHQNGSWQSCSEDPVPFLVKFYPDVSGLPGGEVCSYAVSAYGFGTGLVFNTFPLYRYDIELGSPCEQSSGWVSVQGAGDPDCWFLWMSSPTGDGKSLANTGSGPTVANFDLSLCVSPGTGAGVCPGDLNCDGQIDFEDINPFVLHLSNYAAWQAEFPNCNPLNGDINGDGTYGQASFEDINPFVALFAGLPPIPCP